jgi:3-mercaptopyruvate sulfurtransferase SseA
VALRLKRHGVTRVRPLLGGLTLWMERQFPVERITERSSDAAMLGETSS